MSFGYYAKRRRYDCIYTAQFGNPAVRKGRAGFVLIDDIINWRAKSGFKAIC